MKKLLLSLGACLAIITASFSQTTIFQDDFESGSSQWTLNTGSGTNNWVVNNAYLGFAGIIPDTPNQPGAITNSPQSTYMHITNTAVCGGLGACNANFDTGAASDQNAEVATSIDASTYTNVTVSFWYLCAGQTATSFGTMEYSLDGGSTWVGTGTEYSGAPSWLQETVTMPAWDNTAAFKIRFKWQNGGGGLDPAFSVDEVLIVGTSGGATNTITTSTNLVPASWCQGSTIPMQVDFTSTGTFNAGNIYSAELSDAAGSFAAPTVIGTLASTANSGTIISAVSGATPAGAGYRIRVVSDNPATIGSDNGTDLVINTPPTVTLAAMANVCQTDPSFTLAGGSPLGGTYAGPGVAGGVFDPAVAGLGTHTISYSFTDGNGCSGLAVETITVDNCILNTITTGTNIQPTTWCEGQTFTLQINFTSTGTFNAGNIYSAELSDAAGSFAAPTVIGTLASTANSGMILGVISGATPAGTGYRIRVVSDNPVTIGSDNGVDLIISAPPTVLLTVLADACENDPFYPLTGGSPVGGTYTGPGITGGVFDPAIAGVGTHNVTYFFTDGNGCSGQSSGSITVHPAPSVSFALLSDVCDYTPTFTLSGGTPIGGVYTGVGVSGLVFDPSVAGLGPHLLTYTYTDMITGCEGTEVQTITVDACASVDEKGFENLILYPNPVSESFQLISDYEIESVQVLDMSGRIVKTFGAAQLTYDISSVPSGVYMVTVHSANHIGQLRIVVE
ncbi:MAG: hypothetical protein ACJA1C_000008 [Crocinitomicaceae bacterium]|jgi:hypothetical protein